MALKWKIRNSEWGFSKQLEPIAFEIYENFLKWRVLSSENLVWADIHPIKSNTSPIAQFSAVYDTDSVIEWTLKCDLV